MEETLDVSNEDKVSTRVRFPELDLIRFLAACAVMLFHYTYRGPQIHAWPGSFPFLSQIFRYGYLGVDVFFILSGFVILLTAYEKDAIGFTIARMVRLYPAYWLCVTLTAGVLTLAGNGASIIKPGEYLANLTMAHSFFGVKDVSGVYWTLAVELKFYFLIFLVLVIRQVHRIGYLLGAWLLASVLLFFFHAPGGVLRFFLFPEWSGYFIAGAMFFLIHREGPSLYKFGVIGGGYLLSIINATQAVPAAGGGAANKVSAPVLVMALTVFYLVFLWIALRRRSPGAANRFYTVGLITYPLYLLHQDIGYVLLRAGAWVLNQYILLCLIMAVVIGLSWLIHVSLEKRLALRLKSLLALMVEILSRSKPDWMRRPAGASPLMPIEEPAGFEAPSTAPPAALPAEIVEDHRGATSRAAPIGGNSNLARMSSNSSPAG